MNVFYKRTKIENLHLIWQSMIVFVIMFGFMYAVKQFTNADDALGAIGASSLGSSAFLAFVAHDTAMAKARRLISGYVVGVVMGILGSYCLFLVTHCSGFHCLVGQYDVLIAAGTAAITMIVMVLFAAEHPPAVGIAIGLVLRQWDVSVLLLVGITVVIIAVAKGILQPWLKNLLS